MKPRTFGHWLLLNLRIHNMTQKQLAKKINVAENTIGSWTRNDREIRTTNLVWICKTFAESGSRTYGELLEESSLFFLK